MLLSAARIHDGRKWLPEGTVIELSDDGTVTALHGNADGKEVTHYDGVLAPGFINVHCHLELSHMKAKIPEATGLIPFLQQVMQYREAFTDDQKKEARHIAYKELLDNGVVAVGDIANSPDTIDLRALDKMHMHTFIECIGFSETRAKDQFGFSEKVYDIFNTQDVKAKFIRQSIVPHAPYSVSHAVCKLIDAHDKNAVISMHNQESEAEMLFYRFKTGPVNDLLAGLGIDTAFFQPSGMSSLQTYLQWFSGDHPFIFVHNTYTAKEDVWYATDNFPHTHWCLCPNANLYIESCLPDIDMLMQNTDNICVGTDSLSSNHELSILSELYTIKQHFPGISWEQLLNWGTANGANALQMQSQIGTIEIGKIPGIIHITGLDASTAPTVKRIA